MFEEEKTITLNKPLVLGTGDAAQTWAEITLREPNAGEIAKAQVGAATDTDITINLASAVTKVPRRAIEQLCQRDLRTVGAFFGQISDAGALEAGQS
ncbi:hypothetical protein B0E46_15855 [Rhodanobacter sp. B04]|uniref:phage tail assembly protein n=1 Tax=Rhodanobacter sp. B04 TaxID=1945860 RepID=UPI0009860B81|nr:phage tail assembly protein [Rhodanobacter sp. B04]OOG61450.1 hypothetical protein B0E46_15855 [Rhodanobacter sp. B04]